jgi:hypothetical protein
MVTERWQDALHFWLPKPEGGSGDTKQHRGTDTSLAAEISSGVKEGKDAGLRRTGGIDRLPSKGDHPSPVGEEQEEI